MEPVGRPDSDITRPWSLVAATLLLGMLIFFGAVMPVEFGRDPLGVGRLTGLGKLHDDSSEVAFNGNAGSTTAHTYSSPFREDVIEIPLGYPGGGVGPYSLEYKLSMRAGDVVLYEWVATELEDGQRLEFDFHGHTLAGKKGEPITVATYEKADAAARRGSLVAPFDGIHGWYFANRTANTVKVRLKVSGIYGLIEPGQEGNEARIEPITAKTPSADNSGK